MSGTPPSTKTDSDTPPGANPGPVLSEAPAVKIPEPIAIHEPLAVAVPAPVEPPAPAVSHATTVVSSPKPQSSAGGQPPGFVSRLRGDTPDEGGPRMSFIDHLMELRKRLWVSIITIVVSMIVALIFYDRLFEILRMPLDKINLYYAGLEEYPEILGRLKLPPGSDIVQLTSINLLGTMMMVMWLGIGAGLVISSPIVVYELWSFISPGLRPKEQNAIKPVLYGGIFFFIGGCLLTYYLLFPITLQFVVWLDTSKSFRIRPSYTVDEYLSLLLNMMWITGLICETPLVVGVLAKLGVVKASHLTKYWRVSVLAAFVLGSIFSPGTDIMSMIVFSVLLLSLYIISIFMAWFFYPKQKKENPAQ